MTTDKPEPSLWNMVIWAAVGAVVGLTAAVVVTALRDGGSLAAMVRSDAAITRLALLTLIAGAFVGFTSAARPVRWRSLRKVAIWAATLALAGLALGRGLGALGHGGALGTMDASAKVAAGVGLAYLVLAALGAFALPRLGVDSETALELRRHRRELIYGWIELVGMGLALILLSLAGPQGVIAPAVALGGAVILLAGATLLAVAQWRLMDELKRRLTLETVNLTFYLLALIGGGWAMLAHLGYVAGPAPLDWLSMFAVLPFIAVVIAGAQRGLFRR